VVVRKAPENLVLNEVDQKEEVVVVVKLKVK
jgi:hypothetical protein